MSQSKNWIKGALSGHKPGALHRMLGLSENEVLPLNLLKKIKASSLGSKIRYSYLGRMGIVHREYTVTPLLKKRAVLAVTLRKIGS